MLWNPIIRREGMGGERRSIIGRLIFIIIFVFKKLKNNRFKSKLWISYALKRFNRKFGRVLKLQLSWHLVGLCSAKDILQFLSRALKDRPTRALLFKTRYSVTLMTTTRSSVGNFIIFSTRQTYVGRKSLKVNWKFKLYLKPRKESLSVFYSHSI